MQNTKRKIIHKRVRARVIGKPKQPRLFVFKSNNHIYAGIADDTVGKIIFSVSDKSLNKIKDKKGMEVAKIVGEELAKKAIEAGYKNVIFDRGGYKYHGKIKALADGARAAGLNF
ncbi:MAG: 50S ribosomal protein L18 [Candidatus Spechtbacteria bacterium RIFCSPLOWO2_02_FULL_38_8]|uniref:Large ribosomal subunit protein uL18 n=1 Tax=Candidatus Spechtbacteria bacterium RIFCSPLOWO2_02_FULL_38_8 TaxID=1802164 RepID=A0A1G2HGG8_9BACT|nr:MAG: 50S ribosomal protein L18 [Candidatus Spechtbacteria bacterium RIFCSPLOWO2_02_FULL_38_8]